MRTSTGRCGASVPVRDSVIETPSMLPPAAFLPPASARQACWVRQANQSIFLAAAAVLTRFVVTRCRSRPPDLLVGLSGWDHPELAPGCDAARLRCHAAVLDRELDRVRRRDDFAAVVAYPFEQLVDRLGDRIASSTDEDDDGAGVGVDALDEIGVQRERRSVQFR